jgi:hypothetical protein
VKLADTVSRVPAITKDPWPSHHLGLLAPDSVRRTLSPRAPNRSYWSVSPRFSLSHIPPVLPRASLVSMALHTPTAVGPQTTEGRWELNLTLEQLPWKLCSRRGDRGCRASQSQPPDNSLSASAPAHQHECIWISQIPIAHLNLKFLYQCPLVSNTLLHPVTIRQLSPGGSEEKVTSSTRGCQRYRLIYKRIDFARLRRPALAEDENHRAIKRVTG